MQLDRNMLNKLLSLNDKQLEAVVRRFAEEYGLDLSQFHVSPGNMESLRQALRTATDDKAGADIAKASIGSGEVG